MAGELVERLRQAADMRDDLKERYWHRASSLKREAADRIESLEREIATLRAEKDEARKALEPFAQAANGFDRIPKQVGGKRALGVPDDFHILKTLTVGDLRRARAAAIRNMGGGENE